MLKLACIDFEDSFMRMFAIPQEFFIRLQHCNGLIHIRPPRPPLPQPQINSAEKVEFPVMYYVVFLQEFVTCRSHYQFDPFCLFLPRSLLSRVDPHETNISRSFIEFINLTCFPIQHYFGVVFEAFQSYAALRFALPVARAAFFY